MVQQTVSSSSGVESEQESRQQDSELLTGEEIDFIKEELKAENMIDRDDEGIPRYTDFVARIMHKLDAIRVQRTEI